MQLGMKLLPDLYGACLRVSVGVIGLTEPAWLVMTRSLKDIMKCFEATPNPRGDLRPAYAAQELHSWAALADGV